MIAIIDYGAGNLQSVNKALRHIGCDCVVTRDRDVILKADGAVLPGVGSFGDTVDTLNKYGIGDTAVNYIKSGKPFFGICLGLQLLFPESEESPGADGLGIFEGSITRIPAADGLKIPHMGWNSLDIKKHGRLFKGIEGSPYVYFVHSYFLNAADKQILALSPALEYIHQHYMNTFPIEDLAALCHLSPTHFRRLFHEQIGTTPLDFLHQVRVAASCALLRTSDSSIASIASQVGYASLSCYNRHFLQNMGATPSDWRKASQGEARPSVLTYTGWRKPETSEEILRKNL